MSDVLITGTSRGIGKAIACKFLRNGYSVTGIDVNDSTISLPGYTHCVTDMTISSVRHFLINDNNQKIIVLNAGIQTGTRKDVDVNLIQTIEFAEYIKSFRNLKSLLFIASTSATTGAEFSYYCASKGGIKSYSRHLALELASRGITVNSLSPGGVYNELNRHITDNASLYERVLNETLLHKWSTDDEIADWSYFITAQNKSMTGQDIIVDNGETVKQNFIW